MMLLIGIGIQMPCWSQYTDNPLKGQEWLSLGGGVNSADGYAWQALATGNLRGEFFLNQVRVGYSQQLMEKPNDPFSFRKNRLAEVAYLLGDGWGGKHWYASGAAGFALNVRMYADSGEYKLRYVTAVSPGIAAQMDVGLWFNSKWGAGLSLVGNLNFRQSYGGVLFGIHYRLKQ